MDTVIPYDFFPLLELLAPLVGRVRRWSDCEHHRLYALVDDFLQGRLGSVITQEIGNALFTVVDSYARYLLKQAEVDAAKLRVLSDFCDYLKSQGVALHSY